MFLRYSYEVLFDIRVSPHGFSTLHLKSWLPFPDVDTPLFFSPLFCNGLASSLVVGSIKVSHLMMYVWTKHIIFEGCLFEDVKFFEGQKSCGGVYDDGISKFISGICRLSERKESEIGCMRE